MRAALSLRLLVALAVTFAIAGWSAKVIGTTNLNVALVITFAWATVSARRFLASGRTAPVQQFRWSGDLILSVFTGQFLWMAVPMARLLQPHAWFWQPVPIPATFMAAGVCVSLYWPLHPLVHQLWTRQPAARNFSTLDVPLLCCSSFLISGSLIFGASACASLLHLIFTQMPQTEDTASNVLICHVES